MKLNEMKLCWILVYDSATQENVSIFIMLGHAVLYRTIDKMSISIGEH